MTNGSFPMHFPMTWRGECELMCQYNEFTSIVWKWKIPCKFSHEMKKQIHFLVWHEEALINWNERWKDGQYDGQWENPHAFLHVTWKCIGWLRWLNGWMANRMANGRFPMTWRGNYIFSCDMKRHWLVEKTKFINFNWFPMTKIILNPIILSLLFVK
jgi:hypothetical protein